MPKCSANRKWSVVEGHESAGNDCEDQFGNCAVKVNEKLASLMSRSHALSGSGDATVLF